MFCLNSALNSYWISNFFPILKVVYRAFMSLYWSRSVCFVINTETYFMVKSCNFSFGPPHFFSRFTTRLASPMIYIQQRPAPKQPCDFDPQVNKQKHIGPRRLMKIRVVGLSLSEESLLK